MAENSKIIRTPTRIAGGITADERARLDDHARLWIKRAFRTEPIEPDKIIPAIEGIYAAAKLKRPRVVIAPSPLVMAFAYGAASAIWAGRAVDAAREATRAADEADAATREATDDAVSAATDEATRGVADAATDAAARAACDAVSTVTYEAYAATDAAARAATRTAANAATRPTDEATRVAAYKATRAATDDATDVATFLAHATTHAATREATFEAASEATDEAVSEATDEATRVATDEAVSVATDEATDAATDTATHWVTVRATDTATRTVTYRATDAATDAVNSGATADVVTSAVSAATRATDVATDGAARACYDLAGQDGLNRARRWFAAYQGGNMWPGAECYLTAMRDILGLRLPEYEAYAPWEQAAIHGGFRVMHEEFCIVSDFPEFIRVDDANRPHCENGPSHRWRDGWSLYHWHGVRVPPHWIEQRATLDPNEVIAAENVEQRAAGAAIVGLPRMLSVLKAKVIDDSGNDDIGQLIELTLPGLPEPGRFLKAVCPRNGTIIEGVPRVSDIDGLPINTAIAAQAWRIGDPQAEYTHPPVRT